MPVDAFAPATDPNSRRRLFALALLCLLILVAWEALGADRPLSHLVGDDHGFAWRNHWLPSLWLHDGGRLLAALALAVLAWDVWRPLAPGPSRAQRAYWLGVVVAGLVLVPLIKRFSHTSCPWDLAEFGGTAVYAPHWLMGVNDGGSGHCFPSGHAVAAFAFFGTACLWRRHAPKQATQIFAVVLVLGAAFGWAQWVRGAHFVSHTLWSAWLCGVLCLVAERWAPGRVAQTQPAKL